MTTEEVKAVLKGQSHEKVCDIIKVRQQFLKF
jgi:hypothetical protein